MDERSKERLQQILLKDLTTLTKEDKAFLKARQSYLTIDQKSAYKYILDPMAKARDAKKKK